MAALIGVIVLAACTGGGGEGATGDTSGGQAQSGGLSGELVVATGNTGFHTWAPHEAGSDTLAMYKLMHDTLFRVNPETRQIEGMLAESYDVSDDGPTWTLRLRPNVQ